MGQKDEVLGRLREEEERWEELLRGRSEEEIVAHTLPNGWSLKDVMAHLMAWQQTTEARMQAAREGREPVLPAFAEHENERVGPPDAENAWIYDTYQDVIWADIHRRWREGFDRVLKAGAAIPEADLLDKEKYAWLEGYSVYDILQSSYEHHHIEHYEPLQEWLWKDEG